jgi:multidrug resistance efflux pump
VDPGELVPPNRPIVSIIDYQNLWTDLYIPENALEHVKMGQSVSVRSPVYPGRVFQGRVAFVSPKSEFVPNSSSASAPTEQSSFRVKVQVQPHDTAGQTQLHPGMKVQVSFRP